MMLFSAHVINLKRSCIKLGRHVTVLTPIVSAGLNELALLAADCHVGQLRRRRIFARLQQLTCTRFQDAEDVIQALERLDRCSFVVGEASLPRLLGEFIHPKHRVVRKLPLENGFCSGRSHRHVKPGEYVARF